MTKQDIQDRFIEGLSWKTLLTILSCTVSIVTALVWGYYGIQSSIRDVKVELTSQIDTVKTNQMREHYQNQLQFQELRHKIDEKK